MKKKGFVIALCVALMMASACALAQDYITCDLCGFTFEAGSEYDTHTCVDNMEGPGYVYCAECGGRYMEGAEYDNHQCAAIIEEPAFVYCAECGEVYEEGAEYDNHQCVITCPVCGYLFRAGAEYDNHVCTPEEAIEYVQCDVCGGWYESGNVFRNHICTPPVQEHEIEYVYCDVCGGWYESGNVFRNHVCVSSDVATEDDFIYCSVCGKWYVKGNDYNTHSCKSQYVYCSICGGTYLEGSEYRNHICVPKPDPNQTAIGTLYVDTANGGNLRMRARPDTNSSEVTSLKNGTAVTLFSYVNSQWAYVGYRSYFGYCMVRHLSDVKPGTKPAATPMPVTPTQQNVYSNFRAANYWVLVTPSVPTGFVNLRWAPSLDAPVQSIYYANTPLRVLASNSTWCQVLDENNNVCGFMMSAYLKRVLN